MKNLMDKLTTYASLVGVVTAIGGGFYAWGEFNTRLSAIEGAGVDISGISKNAEQIAVINEKIEKLDLSSIAVVTEKSEDNEEESSLMSCRARAVLCCSGIYLLVRYTRYEELLEHTKLDDHTYTRGKILVATVAKYAMMLNL